jgi:phage FluMu protein Com
MPLKVLLAGCPEDERKRLESIVRSVIGSRAEEGDWNVSLVRIADKWSVHLDGPHEGLRGVSFIGAEAELRDGLLKHLRKAGMAGPAARGETGAADDGAPVAGPSDAQRERYTCATCKKVFAVVYSAYPNEGRSHVPVACPHCWQLNQVPVGQWAAAGEEYRAEKEE